jgi:hypothetical protein
MHDGAVRGIFAQNNYYYALPIKYYEKKKLRNNIIESKRYLFFTSIAYNTKEELNAYNDINYYHSETMD